MSHSNPDTIRVDAAEMQQRFAEVLIRHGLREDTAQSCAEIFTQSGLDGIYTHGVNRFPRFIRYLKEGVIQPLGVPTLEQSMGAWEQWNGHRGPGITNALSSMDRAITLAREYGIGCVALNNTNHWMRGGSYGWQAAKAGFAAACWTNTIANMPAWGGKDPRLGNNPLILALPYKGEAVVLDMAMSQYSYGALEQAALKGTTLEVPGGFDPEGNPTRDPSAILESNRPLPVGYWKGAGLSLMLDLFATILSGGQATFQISQKEIESGLSQVFIAIDLAKATPYGGITRAISSVLEDYKKSVPATDSDRIVYPGERVLETRKQNSRLGIPVLSLIWEEILRL